MFVSDNNYPVSSHNYNDLVSFNELASRNNELGSRYYELASRYYELVSHYNELVCVIISWLLVYRVTITLNMTVFAFRAFV